MGVNDVESADRVFHREEVVDERPAHVVDFIDEAGVQGEGAAVVVDAVDAVVEGLARALPGEDVDVVAGACGVSNPDRITRAPWACSLDAST